jgi:exosortase
VLVAAALAVGLSWAYWPTLQALARRWAQDPQYTHGYVVPAFALLVLWLRRDGFPTGARPSWWGLPLVLAGAALRLAGAYYSVEWLDAGSLVPALAGLCVLLGGWAGLRWAWPALAFLGFILPLPYQVDVLLAGPLRGLATRASAYALQTLGVAAAAEGNVIALDDLQVGVAEACSGLGMLMTFFALSAAVAFVVRRPRWQKGVLVLSAVPVGVLMNVLRITATVLLFRYAGASVARVVFHDLAGWVMMPLALAALGLEMQFLGRLFVETESAGPVPVPLAPPERQARPLTAAAGSLLETTDTAG